MDESFVRIPLHYLVVPQVGLFLYQGFHTAYNFLLQRAKKERKFVSDKIFIGKAINEFLYYLVCSDMKAQIKEAYESKKALIDRSILNYCKESKDDILASDIADHWRTENWKDLKRYLLATKGISKPKKKSNLQMGMLSFSELRGDYRRNYKLVAFLHNHILPEGGATEKKKKFVKILIELDLLDLVQTYGGLDTPIISLFNRLDRQELWAYQQKEEKWRRRKHFLAFILDNMHARALRPSSINIVLGEAGLQRMIMSYL